jgi:hypothetical protein
MTTPNSQCHLRRISFWTPILVCLGINSAIFADIAFNNRHYLLNYRLNANPDALSYVLLGRNTLLQGHYSRSESPPYEPDMLRTPSSRRSGAQCPRPPRGGLIRDQVTWRPCGPTTRAMSG